LREVIGETEALTGREIDRVYVDKGYVGHDAPKPNRVYRSGQKRGVHGQIKKELRRRSDQRRHERRRLQLPPHPQMVEAPVVQNHHRDMGRDNTPISAQTRFLTAD
jgi:hypothetical protein